MSTSIPWLSDTMKRRVARIPEWRARSGPTTVLDPETRSDERRIARTMTEESGMMEAMPVKRGVRGIGRRRRITLALAALVGALAVGHPGSVDAQAGTSTTEMVPAGSLVIAMDNDKQNIGNPFNLKAYGLAVSMLNGDIPVKWVISDFKGKDGIDFTGTATRIAPSALPATTLNFAGGPFVIHNAYADSAKKVIASFGGNVAVYELTQNVSVPVRYNLLFKPRPYINTSNAGIASGILIEAGITTYTIGPDGFLGNAPCYTILLEPHNSNTSGLPAIQDFLANGGNAFFQCESVHSFENAANFMTTNGVVVNNVGDVHTYPEPTQPYSQFIGPLEPAPGGSVQDWILAPSSSYLSGVEHHLQNGSGTHRAATVHDVYAGDGGNIFYLGGHSYDTNSIPEVNGARMMLNAVMTPVTRLQICNIEELGIPIPDLSLSKSSPPSFTGSQGTYSFTVSNLGTASTPDTIMVTDTLPTGLFFSSGSGTGWTFTTDPSQQIVTAKYPASLAPGGSISFTLTVDITLAAAGTVTNRAWVAEQNELNLANNVATATTDIPAITGLVFEDFNQNGLVDPDEVGLPGIRVLVYNTAGDTLEAVTDANGFWAVVGMTPGPAVVKVVEEDLPAGAFHTSAGEDPSDIIAPTASILDAGIDGYAGLLANLSVVKTGPATALVSDTITYLITTTNTGPAVARLVVVRDTLHQAVTLVSASRGAELLGDVLTWPVIELAVGGSVVDTVRVGLPAGVDTIPNVATAFGIREDPDLTDNVSTITTALTQPDLEIAKTHTGDFSVGGNGVFTITVSNNGTGTALPNTVVTDTLRTGLTFVSGAGIIGDWSFVHTDSVVVATLPTPLEPGASASFTLTTLVGAAALPSVGNIAWVAGQREANTANNSAADTAFVRTPDLTVSKSAEPFTQGENGTYTITVRNIGDGASNGTITVVDTLQTGLTYVGGAGVIGSWSVTAEGQAVTATHAASIAPGDSARFTITVLPGASTVPSVGNTVWVSGGGEIETGNNSATIDTPVSGAPDVTVAKTDAGPFTYGSNGSYTVTVTNIGGAPTTGPIVVTDTLPAGLTFVSGSGADWSIVDSADGTVITATYTGADLAALNGTASFTLTVSVFTTAASVTNTAWVAGGGETNTGNNGGSVTTTVTPQPDLIIAKTGPESMLVGQNAVYTITVTNIGAAATSGTITVVDTVSATLDVRSVARGGFNSASEGTGQVVTATYDAGSTPLAPGASISFTITVRPLADAVPSVTNVARVEGGSDANLTNNTGSVTIPVAAAGDPADLIVSKTSSTFSYGQTNATYGITVRNAGGTDATAGFTVTDTLPTGVAYVSGTGSDWTVGGVLDPGTGRWIVTATYGKTLKPNENAPVLTLTVSVDQSAEPSLTNTVHVAGGGETNTTNNSGSVTTDLIRGDLTLVKTSDAFVYGANERYFITVSNAGPGGSYGTVTVTDTLPAGLTYVSASGTGWTVGVTLDPGTGRWIVTATSQQVVLAGANYNVLTITATVTSSTVSPVTNTAHVSGGNESNTTNNSGSVTNDISGADLAITKSTTLSLFIPGQPANYTISVASVGTARADQPIVVTDTLPLGIVPTLPPTVNVGWNTITATLDGGTGRYVLTATRTSNMNVGVTASFTFDVAVTADAVPVAYNRAWVSGVNNNNPENDSSSVTTPVAAPDLTIAKTAGSTFYVGGNAVYRIVVRNIGTTATTGSIVVTDSLSAGLTFNLAGSSGTGWSFDAIGPVVTATYAGPALASNDSTVFLLGVSVGPEAAGTVDNTATVSGGGEVETGNNSSTVTTPVGAQSDLTVAKSSGTFTYGTDGTYTLLVSNIGTIETSGTITVTDTLPAGLTFVQGSGAGAGWTVTAVDNVVTATSAGPIEAGGTSSFTFQVEVGALAIPSVFNRARVAGGGQLNTTNDVGSFTTTVLAPDLTILKTAGAFEALQEGIYTITVTNSGTSPTTDVITVLDTLTSDFTFVSGSGTGWTVTANGQVVTATYTDPLGAGQSATFTITVMVEAAAGVIVENTATVSGGGEANEENNNDSTSTTVGGKPDLVIVKALAAPLVKGQVGSYTITVTNAGNATTTAGITVTDELPAGIAYATSSAPGWVISASGQTVTATYAGAIDVGDSVSFTLNVTVTADRGTEITNTATVSGGGEDETGNNTSDPVVTTVLAPDLVVAKTAEPLFTGADATYSFVVTNSGDATTFGTITVVDTIPTGLQYIAAEGTGWTFFYTTLSRVLTASYDGLLTPGATATFTVDVTVTAAADATVTNRARVSGGGDGDTGNNSSESVEVVGGMPDLTVIKIANDIFAPGGSGSYTLTVTNSGSAPTTADIVATDILPTGLSYVSATGTGWIIGEVGGTVTATYAGVLAAGESAAFTLNVSVSAVDGTEIENIVTVSGGGEVNTGNNTGSATVTVIGQPGLSLTKTVDPPQFVRPGEELTYTITFENIGNADAWEIVVTDHLPTQIFFKLGSILTTLPAGMTAALEYFDGSVWTTDPPASTCTAAPTGYNGCVTKIRWSVEQPLPPGGQGSIVLVVLVK